MTIRECYDELGLDFDAVLSRLVNEKLVQKFALKFLDDPSFQNLKDALDSKDVETAFRAAHTLKGVCLNLGFDNIEGHIIHTTIDDHIGQSTGWLYIQIMHGFYGG